MARHDDGAEVFGAQAPAAPPRWAWAAAFAWMALTALLLWALQPAGPWLSLCRS